MRRTKHISPIHISENNLIGEYMKLKYVTNIRYQSIALPLRGTGKFEDSALFLGTNLGYNFQGIYPNLPYGLFDPL